VTPRLHWPNAIITSAALLVASVISGVALLLSLVAAGQTHEQAITQTLHEVNGNKAMIFAVCRALKRRDVFDQHRLDNAKKIEFRHVAMTKPFAPVVKDYFHARRVQIATVDAEHKKQFVDSNCMALMQKAYDDGYRAPVSTTATPTFLPTGLTSPR